MANTTLMIQPCQARCTLATSCKLSCTLLQDRQLTPVGATYSSTQPGQRYALYHTRCTLVTRGYYYAPHLLLDRAKVYSAREFSVPFRNQEIIGTFTALRRGSQRLSESPSYPVFHIYLLSLGHYLSQRTSAEVERQLSISEFL